VQTKGNQIDIAIHDNNRSVTDEMITRLGMFRFTTKKQGSGLGLLFVKRVSALCDGSFFAERSELGGVSATIRLRKGIVE